MESSASVLSGESGFCGAFGSLRWFKANVSSKAKRMTAAPTSKILTVVLRFNCLYPLPHQFLPDALRFQQHLADLAHRPTAADGLGYDVRLLANQLMGIGYRYRQTDFFEQRQIRQVISHEGDFICVVAGVRNDLIKHFCLVANAVKEHINAEFPASNGKGRRRTTRDDAPF